MVQYEIRCEIQHIEYERLKTPLIQNTVCLLHGHHSVSHLDKLKNYAKKMPQS